jgi:aryl-alcohol dehydrogenase-like predicted oxidoreductase
LTGKYNAEQKPERARLIEQALYNRRYYHQAYLDIAGRFVAHAQERGVRPAALALAWVMAHPAVTAPIVGARTVEQLNDTLGALDIKMTPEWRAEIAALSPTPPDATDRNL